MRRFLPTALVLACAFVAIQATANAQADDGRVEVIVVSKAIDDRLAEFVIETIEQAGARGSNLVILQIDSPAVVAAPATYRELLDVISDPPLPLVVWIGPNPAVATGGVAEIAAAAPLSFGAIGVDVGDVAPVIATSPEIAVTIDGLDSLLDERRTVTSDPVEPIVDRTANTVNDVFQTVDGMALPVRGADVVVRTVTEIEVDGETVLTALNPVIHEPGYWDRFLRLALTPEAVMFFLLIGLTVAAFEFYAIGPGLAAATAAVALFLASYGLATLPVRWWSLALLLLGWWLLTVSYQRGTVAVLGVLGMLAVLVGGLISGTEQIRTSVPAVLAISAGVAFFYFAAMPTVARSRFSTRTIGREHLIGTHGVARTDFDPGGFVEVDGARWRAEAHREAGISSGDGIVVVEVDGPILEVERASQPDI